MRFNDDKHQAGTALLRWGLVLTLHAGLFWIGAGLLKPAAAPVPPQRLTSVRLISEPAPTPPPQARTVRATAPLAKPSTARPPTASIAPDEPLPVPTSPTIQAQAAPEPATAATAASGAASALTLDAGTISRAIRSAQAGTVGAQARSVGRDDQLRSPTPDQMAEAIKKTKRRDCRTAYAAAGLLAVIPLAISTVTDTGCTWN